MPRAGGIPGCTIGPAGSVDFEDLVRRFSEGGYFVDKDFPAGEDAIWTEGTRSGFGTIRDLPKVSAGRLVCCTRASMRPAAPSGSVRLGNL